ncbi:hypothetical protein DUNSADRAFT_12276 [Dunaliella salina]|uniref:Uncharacterized protein n=1 Tax=Dunaliella salina TaxID=3046 RepID=A0ABQ7H3Z4_DUNSA|nr:hypothetical protein DUNSADRAFT_12276 [Dunaliella salina]|eukprot:KAF5841578.1 hypothetical protein DUNSADRAFT_12276 [Dunaliella salina]
MLRLSKLSRLLVGLPSPGCQQLSSRMMHSSVGCLEQNVGGHMTSYEPHEIEEAKERMLKGKGRPQGIPNMEGWEQSLASASEAIVKAEKMTGDMSPEDLQKLAVEMVLSKEERAKPAQ